MNAQHTPRRSFNANPPPGSERCCATIYLRDKSAAQCMRRAKVNRMCRQHAAKAEGRT